jgi:hypothetical protein
MSPEKLSTLVLFCIILTGCLSVPKGSDAPKAKRVINITYQNANYRVPEEEIWKLTWKSPYKAWEVHPAYDVRVMGSCLTSMDLGTWIGAYSSQPGERGLVDISAGIAPAEIWIPWETQFSIANDLILVKVESYNKAEMIKFNKALDSDAVNRARER